MALLYALLVVGLFCFCRPVNGIRRYYMEGNCGRTEDTDDRALRLRLARQTYYNWGNYCTVTVRAGEDRRMMLYFRSMDIEFSPHCTTAGLALYDGDSLLSPLLGDRAYCGSSFPPGLLTTSGSRLTLRFTSSSRQSVWSDFDIVITPYHTGSCTSQEYACDNGRCINKNDVCNGYNSCGDNSDCDHLPVGAIVGSVIAVVVLIVIIVVAVVLCRRCRHHHHHHHKYRGF